MADVDFESDVRSALRAHLLTVDGLTKHVRWERRRFDPATVPVGIAWLRETLVRPRTASRNTVGANATMEHNGLYRLDLLMHDTTDNAPVPLERAAAVIRSKFTGSIELVFGGHKVHVRSAGVGTLDWEKPHWDVAPITITWTSYVIAPT